MAVRHGYGKIAGTDALVFAYDTGDTRNSYKGEPTENLFSTTAMSFQDDAGVYTNDIESGTDDIGNYFIKDVNNAPWWSGLRIYNNSVTPLTPGVSYVLSFECRSGQTGWSWSYDANASGGGWSGNDAGRASNTNLVFDKTGGISYTSDMVNTWQRVTYRVTMKDSSTFTGASAYPHDSFFTNTNNVKIYYRNPQLEVGKSHATQFVDGTRSATEGLKDLTGNSSIDLTNAGFNSNAEIDLDGTNESFEIGNYVASQGNVGSIEVVFKADDNHRGAMVGWGDLGTSNWGSFEIGPSTSGYSDEFISYVNSSAGSGYTLTMLGRDSTAGSYKLNDGKYHHAVAIVDGVENTIYVDGEKVSTLNYQHGSATAEEFLKQTSTTNVRIGNSTYNGGHIPFDGQIPLVKIYNRALTTAEIQSNYRHYKKRFNI